LRQSDFSNYGKILPETFILIGAVLRAAIGIG